MKTPLLEDECLRRARDGVKVPRFHNGKISGYVRRSSDALLIFLLKARRPEKYRDRIKATQIWVGLKSRRATEAPECAGQRAPS